MLHGYPWIGPLPPPGDPTAVPMPHCGPGACERIITYFILKRRAWISPVQEPPGPTLGASKCPTVPTLENLTATSVKLSAFWTPILLNPRMCKQSGSMLRLSGHSFLTARSTTTFRHKLTPEYAVSTQDNDNSDSREAEKEAAAETQGLILQNKPG